MAAAGEQVKHGGRTRRGARTPSIVAIGWLLSSLAMAAPPTRVDVNAAPTPAKAQTPAVATDESAPKAPPQTLDLSPSVLKAAVVAADEDYAPPTAKGTPFGRLPAPSPQAKIDRAFEAAELGRCGGPDTLKFESLPVWGDFTIGGLFVFPYALHAMATGRCKF